MKSVEHGLCGRRSIARLADEHLLHAVKAAIADQRSVNLTRLAVQLKFDGFDASAVKIAQTEIHGLAEAIASACRHR